MSHPISKHQVNSKLGNRKVKLITYSRLAIILFSLLGFFTLFLSVENQYLIFTSTGFFAAAIIFIPPAIIKNYDIFSTWSLASVSILLGATIRGIYIGFEYPDYNTLDYFFFLGHTPDYFIMPALLLLACLFFMAMGFVVGPIKKKKALPNFSEKYNFNKKRLYLFVFVALIISLISIYFYVSFTGGFDLQNLSKKRASIDSLQLSADHRTWQSFRYFASISMLAHLLVLADALQSKGKRKMLKYALAMSLFLVAIFIPFYASSRGIVFMYGIFSLALIYYIKKELQISKILIILFSAVFVFQIMSVLRTAKDISVGDVASETSFDLKILDRLVLNRNDLELGKTAHIMNAIPDSLELQYGKTIGVWLVAPIPREFWHSKPLISSGPIIGTVIYGNRISGVPPGFVGEMFWNFHIFGVIIGGFLLGWLLRWAHTKFNPLYSKSLANIVVYIYGPMQLGYLVIGTSVGFGIINAAVATLLSYLILRVIKV